MNGLLARARSFWRGFRRPNQLAAEMEEEMRFHIEMEAERLVRERGLEPAEARRQAAIAFGGVEKYKDEGRDARGLTWVAGMSLDLKLAVRMLVKYPGLTAVATVGMAVGIGIGAACFAVLSTITDPKLPIDQGERVFALQNLDPTSDDQSHGRTQLHDLEAWRVGLRAIEDLGAFRTVNRNLITPGGGIEPVRVAEMTASGFQLARVSPLLGRHFVQEDEAKSAPPVIVLGHDLWQSRFAGDSAIIGRTIQLGTGRHTVIGVMPRGFAFPVNNRVWTPFQLDASDFPVGQAPPVQVFGRLSPGATIAEAEAQVAMIGRRLAEAYPATHENMRPRVISYPRSFMEAPDLIWALHLAQLFITLILVVIGINVAALIYARTATRTGEIAVRTALGASRTRVVMQLFAEALVLSTAAAAVGLVGASFILRKVTAFVSQGGGEQVPFWWRFELSAGTLLYVAGLVILAAVLVGVVPALKATGRNVHGVVGTYSPGGSGLQLGRMWTAIIVAQVALAVAVMPLATRGVSEFLRYRGTDQGVATSQFLTASLQFDRTTPSVDADDDGFAARWVSLHQEVVRRVEAEPGISGVVSSTAVPGAEPDTRIEVEDPASRGRPGPASHDAAHVAHVDVDFFDVLEIPMLAGRSFHSGDFRAGADAVIVSSGFVERVLGGRQPLGQRVRYAAPGRGDVREPGAWLEIVGVVADFPVPVGLKAGAPRMYRPLLPQDVHHAVLAARVRAEPPAAFANRVREIAMQVDPMLRVVDAKPLDAAMREQQTPTVLTIGVLALLSLSGLLLSAAGISALMSFTVARRRREIGIRSALGAQPRRVLSGVLARALRQIGIGMVVGLGLAGLLDQAAGGAMLGREGPLFLVAAAVLMAVMGTLAAWSPARRGLRIHPAEALRAE